MTALTIHPAAHIGHVHLRVADLDRAIAFYRDMLGFTVTASTPDMAFLAGGDYHHHIGLNTFTSAGGTPASPEHTGLYHLAILYPDRRALAAAVRWLLDHEYPFTKGEDHGAEVAVYLDDPDGNGIELYYDRPRAAWFDAHGQPIVKADRFDPRALLAEEMATSVA